MANIQNRIDALKTEQETLVKIHGEQLQAWQAQATQNQTRANEITGALKELESLKTAE